MRLASSLRVYQANRPPSRDTNAVSRVYTQFLPHAAL